MKSSWLLACALAIGCSKKADPMCAYMKQFDERTTDQLSKAMDRLRDVSDRPVSGADRELASIVRNQAARLGEVGFAMKQFTIEDDDVRRANDEAIAVLDEYGDVLRAHADAIEKGDLAAFAATNEKIVVAQQHLSDVGRKMVERSKRCEKH